MDRFEKFKITLDPADQKKLRSEGLCDLTMFDPTLAPVQCLRALILNVNSLRLNFRHKSIMSIGELLHTLSEINFTPVAWQQFIDSCLENKRADIRKAAGSALTHLCENFYSEEDEKTVDTRNSIIRKYLQMVLSYSESNRIGYSLALGCLPQVMLRGHVDEICHALTQCSQLDADTMLWGEARASALRALVNVCTTMRLRNTDSEADGSEFVIQAMYTLLAAFSDYTYFDKKDIGSYVRKAALFGIRDLLIIILDEAPQLISIGLAYRTMLNIVRQAVSRNDRIRTIAVRVFFTLLHKDGRRITIPNMDSILTIFNKEACDSINVYLREDTFKMFVKLLTLPEYSCPMVLALIESGGGAPGNKANCTWQAITNHLRTQKTETLEMVLNAITHAFQSNIHENKVIIPLMTFIERALASSCFDEVLRHPTSPYALNLLNLGVQGLTINQEKEKHIASVTYFCQLVRVGGMVGRRALTELSFMLCNRSFWLRVIVANRMVYSLMAFGHLMYYPAQTANEAVKLLQQTQWQTLNNLAVKQQLDKFWGILSL